MCKHSPESLGSAGDEGEVAIRHVRTLGTLTPIFLALEAVGIAYVHWRL
jgi:hypothetical protein